MRAAILAIFSLLLFPLAAQAEAVSPRPDAVALTIYRDQPADPVLMSRPWYVPRGLALVTETRTIEVPASGGRIRFLGVADGMVPETARIDGLPSGAIERNFDYDLLSPGALLANSVGRRVRLVRTNPVTGAVSEKTAVVRSGPHGVVLDVDGRIEALHCSRLPERLIFDRIPEGLSDRPTLSLKTRSGRAGRYRVRLSYLATGFDWSADYVARISADGRTLDLSGLITLVNRSSASFEDAPTQVVAGRWSRAPDDGTDRPPPRVEQATQECWPDPELIREVFRVTGSRMAPPVNVPAPPPVMAPPPPPPPPPTARGSDLGDYKLYTLPESTTVASRQTKQIGLLDQKGVPFERLYGYDLYIPAARQSEGVSLPADIRLRLQNAAAHHLGVALPAGTVSVREPDGHGRMVLAGEDRLDDTPVGAPFDFRLGRAVDVRVAARILEDRRFGPVKHRRRAVTVETTVSNRKPVAVSFELRHRVDAAGFEIKSEPFAHGSKAGDPLWSFKLQPGETRIISYRLEQDG